jgi:DNA-3-methyladenine glycosylase II
MIHDHTIQTLSQADPVLAQVIQQVEWPTLDSTHSVYHDLMSCIIEQQIHYRSSKNIFTNLLRKANLDLLQPENFDVFEERALPQVKISLRKLETIHRVQETWKQKALDFSKLSDADVRAELAKIPGIGPWTIDMILLYTLLRPNVFPVDDYRLKLIMTDLYALNPATNLRAQMLQIAENWGAYKSTAVLFLLQLKARKK